MSVAIVVYVLCALAALLSTLLLLRGYILTKTRLLLWSTLCFAGLTANNVLVLMDLVLLQEFDLFLWRTLTALLGVMALLFGLLWEGRR